jgi:hypothetical protein
MNLQSLTFSEVTREGVGIVPYGDSFLIEIRSSISDHPSGTEGAS